MHIDCRVGDGNASRIIVRVGDVVEFRDDQYPDRHRVGVVRETRSDVTSAGVIAFYVVSDEENRECVITNVHAPRVIDAQERRAMFEARSMYLVGRSSVGDIGPLVGTFRLHFNRHGAAPLVWCVAVADQWEIAVRGFTSTVPLETVYEPKATPDHDDGKPSAWLRVHGQLTVRGGWAHIAAPEQQC
jgi:hypothetical protein